MAKVYKPFTCLGIVAIPISMYTAAQYNSIHFKQPHKVDNSKLKYKNTCGHCGKEFNLKSLIKGYEYVKEHYVVVTDNDLISLLKKSNWKK
ncbi:hypothetical protein LGK95_13485 [Clostridium algoriphilum]|uniref:Ku protein n=1 Tax=Clostridium algoriphilum TaxID=198347 RepID=UPI001CF19776|nr:Ku protein [Clostridium algoriphilum]MCB2294521.1 hypothetical protein [Clostridium algoriphilum]